MVWLLAGQKSRPGVLLRQRCRESSSTQFKLKLFSVGFDWKTLRFDDHAPAWRRVRDRFWANLMSGR
jgi:hypothetical protein